MSVERVFICDCCKARMLCETLEEGPEGWGQFNGVRWTEEPTTPKDAETHKPKTIDNPMFCTLCMDSIKVHIHGMFQRQQDVGHKLGD